MTPRLSQVLLVDESWVDRCLAEVKPAKFGVEWACGRGALTETLLKKLDQVIGYELDPKFCRELRQTFPGEDFKLVRTDILAYPLPDRRPAYPLIGNLPYHLTGPLLMKILRNSKKISDFHGLVQWEVAKRLTARPGNSDFSSLSLLFQLHGQVNQPYRIPAAAFKPKPEVDSAWINFSPKNHFDDFEQLRRLARICFQFPRKTLLNNLARDKKEKAEWKQFFEQNDWNPQLRPHRLDQEKFLEVFKRWKKENS